MLILEDEVNEAVVSCSKGWHVHQHDASVVREHVDHLSCHPYCVWQWLGKSIQGDGLPEVHISISEERILPLAELWQNWEVNALPCPNLHLRTCIQVTVRQVVAFLYSFDKSLCPLRLSMDDIDSLRLQSDKYQADRPYEAITEGLKELQCCASKENLCSCEVRPF